MANACRRRVSVGGGLLSGGFEMPFAIRAVILAFLAVPLAAAAAWACAFHNYIPQITLVDRLLESDQIVIARPASDDPLRYEALAAFRGSLKGVEIPQPVDPESLRRSTADPEAFVLFTRKRYDRWQKLATADGTFAPVLLDILKRLPGWVENPQTGRARHFASLIGHEDIRAHRLALRELDRVDYATLRRLSLNIEDSEIVARMARLGDPTLQPIQILLLGLSRSPETRSLMVEGIEANLATAAPVLGAYAIALVEIDGPAAVLEVSQTWLKDSALPADSRRLLIEALSIHLRSAGPGLKQHIRIAIATATREDARLTPLTARKFGKPEGISRFPAMSDAAPCVNENSEEPKMTIPKCNPERPSL